MQLFCPYILLYMCMMIAGVMSQSIAPVVQTTYGKVSGYTIEKYSQTITKFSGIPFAKPPVGPLRFQKPENPSPWSETLNATKEGAVCHQSANLPDPTGTVARSIQSEDCLYLNLYIPGTFTDALNSPKAVMVFIYGGGWIVGSATQYNSDTLTALQDVIVVTFNYRLGIFGFFSSPDGTFPGNVGLFDQHAALMWVKDNIGSFGGDSSKITIFGESAGADSVLNQFVSPLSKDLFTRAIIESTPTMGTPISKEKQYSIAKQAAVFKCGEVQSTQQLHDCFIKLSAGDLLKISDSLGIEYRYITIDGEFLKEDPIETLLKGNFDKDKPLIIGYMADDGDFDITYIGKFDFNDFVRRGVSIEQAYHLLKFAVYAYFNADEMPNAAIMENLVYQKYLSCKQSNIEVARGFLDMATDFAFSTVAYRIASMVSMHGGKAYLYEMDPMLTMLTPEGSQLKISGHAHDIYLVFGYTIDLQKYYPITSKEIQMTISVMKAFSEFAKTGLPVYLTNTNQTVPWKPFTLLTKEYLYFTTNMTTHSNKPMPDAMLSRISLWTEVLTGIQHIDTCDPHIMDTRTPLPPIGKGESQRSLPLLVVLTGVLLMPMLF